MKISAKVLEEFEKFLVEEDCFSQFITNLQEQTHISFNEYPNYIERIFSTAKSVYLVLGLVALAFYWSRTKEDYAYWRNIDTKWRKKSENFLNNS